ncbi:GNAT family N-acetyltransferase [Anaerosporobacter sp.]|uniref:GNAT family N-acetyltransferase n=1 Tax=Anaerosporobacter sp. TaxID=1872529 RepID=UPI00286F8FDB|nr:GNAT family N-acetyltransferase [Anaerosporobacter sp.]
MNYLGTKILETERLVLRPFKENDVENMYHNWASSNNVTRYLTWPTHTSKEVTKSVIDFWVSRYDDAKNYQWCIEWKENKQAIGSFAIVHMEEEINSVEIGYCIGEDYWNRGITSEAFKEVIRFVFEEVECNRISARHDVCNPNSGKVMKKAGLLYEGTLLEAAKNNTGICDVAVYGITKKIYSR